MKSHQETQSSSASLTLMVSHSIGDTNTIVEAAKVVAVNEKVQILTIGKAAMRLLNHPIGENITITHVEDIISPPFEHYDVDQFTEDQLVELQHYFSSLAISRVLIGTPSKPHAETFLQIAKLFANDNVVTHKAIFNDYLFHEPEHTYWLKLRLLAESNQEMVWLLNYQLLVPVLDVANKIPEAIPKANVTIVGHTIFSPMTKVPEVRNQLKIQENESLLFVSGSKDQEKDLGLLREIFIKSQGQPQLKIVVGLHPGASDIANYLLQLNQLIKEHNLAQRVSYILTDNISRQLGDAAKTAAYYGIVANIDGNSATSVADGLASVMPASLANQAYLAGTPIYVKQDLDKTYLFSHSNTYHLSTFIIDVATKTSRTPYIAGGVPDVPVGEAIASSLTG